MILLLLDTGLRLSELINLQMDDIDFLQSCILVKGKGNKERVIPFGSQVTRTLRRYIMHFRPEPDSPVTGEVFLTEDGLPLKPRVVQSMLLRLVHLSVALLDVFPFLRRSLSIKYAIPVWIIKKLAVVKDISFSLAKAFMAV